MSTDQRLAKLEQHFTVPSDEAERLRQYHERRRAELSARFSEVESDFRRILEHLVSTMSPEDAQEVGHDFANAPHVPEGLTSPLSHACFWISENACGGFWFPQSHYRGVAERPLALPPVVCRVLRADPDTARSSWSLASSPYDCVDCGYHVPKVSYEMGTRLKAAGLDLGYAPLSYFDRCPLCGGMVGYQAYLYAHDPPNPVKPRRASHVEEVCRGLFGQYPLC